MMHLVALAASLGAGVGSGDSGLNLEGVRFAVHDLRCEYLVNPLGIDVLTPRLSWKLRSSDPGARGLNQSAYRILVASSEEHLHADNGDLWDSGVVSSSQSVHVPYVGVSLPSRSQCVWKVQVWDEHGAESAWSETACWSMGILDPSEWEADWIGLDGTEEQQEHTRLPARMLRRDFRVDAPLTRATAYVCGLGFFDLHLNGTKVGDHLMDPGLTEYRKRLLYVTFDVTRNLSAGENAVGVVLGNGRFFAPRRSVPVPTETYGYPKLLFRLELEYADGRRDAVVSDASWTVTDQGPIRANSEYDGEEYDARMEQSGWDRAGFTGGQWNPAELVSTPGGTLYAQMLEPIRVTETLTPVSITSPVEGVWLIDFGQAVYGVPQITLEGPRGARIEMQTSFNTGADGLLRTENDRSAANTDVYFLRGEGTESWHPRFRGNAFRYIQVKGFPGTPSPANFRSLAVHTDMEPVGEFESSDQLLDRVYANARWGTRLQNRSIPMEPDRDERQGWSGHPAKTSESEAYVFGVAPFYASWLDSIRRDQHADGALQEISPGYWTFGSKGTIWPAVITILPEWYHDFYGDRRILEDNYAAMKRWLEYHIKTNQREDGLVDHVSYGDWVDAATMDLEGEPPFGATSKLLISNAYHYNNCRIVARVAGILGRHEDAQHYGELAQRIRDAFNQRFLDPETNQYESDTQCAYVLPLAFGLAPEELRAAMADRLVQRIEDADCHTSVGLIGMQWFMQVLSDIGRDDIAFRVATQTTRPSWGYMISKGATTIWERWDTDTQGPGMNGESQKILSGNLEAWFYQSLAGIRYDPSQPGFRHIILKPSPVAGLDFVRAKYKSLYGAIGSSWQVDGDTFRWKVSVPPNTQATIHVPTSDEETVLESGQPLGEAAGLSRVSGGPSGVVLAAASGHYTFECVLARGR